MDQANTEERRRSRRFAVEGTLRVQTSRGMLSPEICEIGNVSGVGILFFTKNPPIAGTVIEFRFTIHGYDSEIQAKGRVVREDAHLAVVEFTSKPNGMDDLISWLEAEQSSSAR